MLYLEYNRNNWEKTHQPNPVIGIANIRIAITMNNRISLRSRKCGNKQMWPSLSDYVVVVCPVVVVVVVLGRQLNAFNSLFKFSKNQKRVLINQPLLVFIFQDQFRSVQSKWSCSWDWHTWCTCKKKNKNIANNREGERESERGRKR